MMFYTKYENSEPYESFVINNYQQNEQKAFLFTNGIFETLTFDLKNTKEIEVKLLPRPISM